MVDKSKPVRRMSRPEAIVEARRLAGEFLTTQQDDDWQYEIVNCTPCNFDPKPIGKTPSRWIVGIAYTPRNRSESVVDGADTMVIVDLVTRTASWYENCP